MTTEDTPSTGGLPPGENDPNLLYAAVGRAIHAWEGMEEAFARLFALFMNLPENPYALADYGSENRRFVDRMGALKSAGESYFIRKPNQTHEGELHALIEAASDLSIKRHRIAHGHISMWAHARLPETKGTHEITAAFHFRWAAPFYSMSTLRTNPVGVNAATIAVDQAAFEALHNRIAKFTSELPALPETSAPQRPQASEAGPDDFEGQASKERSSNAFAPARIILGVISIESPGAPADLCVYTQPARIVVGAASVGRFYLLLAKPQRLPRLVSVAWGSVLSRR
jgi:hypothetical protein